MGEPKREFTVVRQQQQPGGMVIETTDREEPFLRLPDDIENRRAAFGIGRCRHDLDRLMQNDVAKLRGGAQRLAIDRNAIDGGIGTRAEFIDALAVYRNSALRNQRLGRAPRCYPGPG